MSADDYMLVRKVGARYGVTREFASDDCIVEWDRRARLFEELDGAMRYASDENAEYGIQYEPGEAMDTVAPIPYDLTHQGMVAAFYYAKLGRLPTPYEARAVLREEIDELAEAIDDDADAEYTLKELADVLYTAYGYAISKGWNLHHAFERTHISNMTRAATAGGKVPRGDDYVPPDLSGCIGASL